MNLAKIYRFTTLAILIAGASGVCNYLGWAFIKLTRFTLLVDVVLSLVISALIAYNFCNSKEDKLWQEKILSISFVGLFLLIGGILQWM